MDKKNLILLSEYWHKHYEHDNFQDYRGFGKTIRRAMDAGQSSAIILRFSPETDYKTVTQWIEQQGLTWTIELKHGYVNLSVQWKPIVSLNHQLKYYWLYERGTKYDIVKRAMDCGQKHAIIDTLHKDEDYTCKDGGEVIYLKEHKESLYNWAKEQGLNWFFILGDNWAFFAVNWTD